MAIDEESMSSFKLYLDCKKAYYYKYIRGLEPLRDKPSAALGIGTLWHAGLAGGYRWLKRQLDGVGIGGDWISAARNAMNDVMSDGYDWHGTKQTIQLEPEDVAVATDMMHYYWHEQGKEDTFYKILAVEEPLPLYLDGRLIHNTIDLLVKTPEGHLQIWDHKSVGSVKDAIKHLPLDTQSNMYSIAAWIKYGEPVEFVHNFQRRAVPKEKTPTGRVSTASKDPADYLARSVAKKSTTELEYLFNEYSQLGKEITARKFWPREPNKSFTGCSGCPYFSVCSNEQTGRKSSDSMLAFEYKIVKP